MIESIELTNWKVHKHTKLDFKKGVNVLVGVMGAGKSSILDAISFGLFGSFPALNHRRSSLEDIITNKPDVENEAEVKVNFTTGEDRYTVSRRIVKNGGSSARLERNGSYLQSQPERVNEEIERILKIDYDTFSRVVYAEQNRLDYFLELAKGDRKRQIDQMLGLDNFARAEDNVVSLANHIKDIVSGEEESAAHVDTESLKAAMRDLASAKEKYAAEQRRLISEIAGIEAKSKEASEQLEKVKAEYDKKQKLSKDIAELAARHATLKAELEKIGNVRSKKDVDSELAKTNDLLQKEGGALKKLKAEEREATKQLSDSEAMLKDAREKLQERDKLVKELEGQKAVELEKKVHELDNALSLALRELAAAQSAYSENEKWARELEKHITACPVCNRELTQELRQKLLEQKTELLNKARAEAASLSERVEQLKRKKSDAEREERAAKLAAEELMSYAGIEEKVAKYGHEVEARRSAAAKIASTADSKAADLDKLKKLSTDLAVELDLISRKERYDSEMAKASSLMESKRSDMEAIKVSEHDVDALHERLSSVREQLGKARENLSGDERMIASIDAQIEEKAKSVAEAESMKARIVRGKKLITDLGKFRSALVDTEGALRSELVKSINNLMQSIWPELYPYLDYPSIRLSAKADDYTLEAATATGEGEQRWSDINTIASGGERSIACLAMRIALAMVVVPNLRWLILDEPTHNLDENGISKLIEVLGNSLPKVVDQIFVITHDNSLRSISSARIYQIERNKNEDEYASAVGIS
ncbi:MAG: AAA family ATPase [Candidatus Micrarchaeia archaeon]